MSRGRDPGPENGAPPPLSLDVALRARPARPGAPEPAFVDLVAATNYSFLRGASHPADMVGQALALGHAGIGIADRNTVAGVVRAWSAIKRIRAICREDATDTKVRSHETSETAQARREQAALLLPQAETFRLVTGARLCFADDTPDIIAYPVNRHGWGRLTRLLSHGNLKHGVQKGNCVLYLSDLIDHAQDMILIAIAGEKDVQSLATLAQVVPGALWIGVTMPRAGSDRRRLARLAAMAQRLRLPLLATCDCFRPMPNGT
jgi:error-prone DNA polymerase